MEMSFLLIMPSNTFLLITLGVCISLLIGIVIYNRKENFDHEVLQTFESHNSEIIAKLKCPSA